jgi:hypothetical protein
MKHSINHHVKYTHRQSYDIPDYLYSFKNLNKIEEECKQVTQEFQKLKKNELFTTEEININ